MMDQAIRDFAKQFSFAPVIENPDKLIIKKRIIVAGMGGSHLAAGIIKTWKPELDLAVHNDYGLPALPEEVLQDSLLIASSYSGNTEEVLDCLRLALDKNVSVAVIAVGGKLMELAVERELPYIKLPDIGIQPRSALGFSVKAMLAMLGQTTALEEVSALAESLKPAELEARGKELADTFSGKVPVIYASKRNSSLTYNWKIKLNETGKVPAFANVIPELNHNEMNGFDPSVKLGSTEPHASDERRALQANYHFIFLMDETDHTQNKKRLDVLERLYNERGLLVTRINLEGSNVWEKIFNNLILADWMAYHTAENYGLEAEQVPMVEAFKKLIA